MNEIANAHHPVRFLAEVNREGPPHANVSAFQFNHDVSLAFLNGRRLVEAECVNSFRFVLSGDDGKLLDGTCFSQIELARNSKLVTN
jgi:hypothetical protein